MVRLVDLPPDERKFLQEYDCPKMETSAFVHGPALNERRICLITTAGLRRQNDSAYGVDSTDYRVIPYDQRGELVMDHVSSGHDRTGFSQDLNVVFPLDRLAELARDEVIASVADFHYSFMGAGDVAQMQPAAQRLAGILHNDGVNAVVLSPV